MVPLKDQHRSLIFFAGDSIYKQCKDPKLQKSLDKSATKLIKLVTTISALLFSGFIAFVALPLYFILNGDRILLISVVLPFTEVDTNWGYFFNVLNMLTLAYLTAFINIGVDSTFVMIITNLWAGVDAVKFAMKDMETLNTLNDNKTEQDIRFRNIVIQIQDLDRYLKKIIINALNPHGDIRYF